MCTGTPVSSKSTGGAAQAATDNKQSCDFKVSKLSENGYFLWKNVILQCKNKQLQFFEESDIQFFSSRCPETDLQH